MLTELYRLWYSLLGYRTIPAPRPRTKFDALYKARLAYAHSRARRAAEIGDAEEIQEHLDREFARMGIE